MDKTEVKKFVGQKVKNYRQYLKLSQFALGEKVGINQRQIAQIECGKSLPSLNTLVKFAEIFHCEIGEFFEKPNLKSEEELKQEVCLIVQELSLEQLEFIHPIIKRLSKVKFKK